MGIIPAMLRHWRLNTHTNHWERNGWDEGGMLLLIISNINISSWVINLIGSSTINEQTQAFMWRAAQHHLLQGLCVSFPFYSLSKTDLRALRILHVITTSSWTRLFFFSVLCESTQPITSSSCLNKNKLRPMKLDWHIEWRPYCLQRSTFSIIIQDKNSDPDFVTWNYFAKFHRLCKLASNRSRRGLLQVLKIFQLFAVLSISSLQLRVHQNNEHIFTYWFILQDVMYREGRPEMF